MTTILLTAALTVLTLAVALRHRLRRVTQTLMSLARDERLPRRYKALVAVGLLPIIGPLDEIVLVGVGIAVALHYRPLLAEHWKATA